MHDEHLMCDIIFIVEITTDAGQEISHFYWLSILLYGH